MNPKQTIAAVAVISIVPYAVMAISSRIAIRRKKKDVVAETNRTISEGLNALTASLKAQRDEVNSHPTMQRIDAILNRFPETN